MFLLAQKAYAMVRLFVSSTLIPLLLFSLSKQKHSPNTAKTILTEYDYIVVGAGSGGSVIASRLSEMPCVNVLLLEAGKPPPLLTEVPALARFFWFTDIDWKFRTAPQKHTGNMLINRQLVWPSGKTLGGSSVLNAMLYVRGNRKNYDQWAAEGAHGWSYKDVLPYFLKLEDNRDPEYVANGFHGVHGPQTIHRPRYQAEIKDPLFRTIKSLGYRVVDPNAYRQTGFYDLQANMRGGQRCSTAKAYLVPAENRPNLHILPYSMVKKIVIQNRRAVGVQFDYQGKPMEVRARREVIMSAGTTNTAQLLMLSGIGPREELQRHGIPVIADLPVGKNLQDHPGCFVPFTFTRKIEPILKKALNPSYISQYIQNRTGPLASTEFISVMAFLKNNAIAPDVDFPDHELYFAEIQSEISYQTGMTPKFFFQVMAPYLGKPAYICVSQLLNPKSIGTVTLMSTDPYDPPVIDPNYFEDPRDVRDIVEGLKACQRIGNHPIMRQEVGSVEFSTLIPGCEQYAGNMDLYYTCAVRSIVVTFSHQVGTARMGDPKDPRTVVDPQLRVLHIEGLRVVDASVMPIVPSGNTNVPTMMVAEKAADIIKSTIQCYKDPEDQWKEITQPGWYDRPQFYNTFIPDSYQQGIREQQWNKPTEFFQSRQENSETDKGEPLIKLEDETWKSDLFDGKESSKHSKDLQKKKHSTAGFSWNPNWMESISPNQTPLLRNSNQMTVSDEKHSAYELSKRPIKLQSHNNLNLQQRQVPRTANSGKSQTNLSREKTLNTILIRIGNPEQNQKASAMPGDAKNYPTANPENGDEKTESTGTLNAKITKNKPAITLLQMPNSRLSESVPWNDEIQLPKLIDNSGKLTFSHLRNQPQTELLKNLNLHLRNQESFNKNQNGYLQNTKLINNKSNLKPINTSPQNTPKYERDPEEVSWKTGGVRELNLPKQASEQFANEQISHGEKPFKIMHSISKNEDSLFKDQENKPWIAELTDSNTSPLSKMFTKKALDVSSWNNNDQKVSFFKSSPVLSENKHKPQPKSTNNLRQPKLQNQLSSNNMTHHHPWKSESSKNKSNNASTQRRVRVKKIPIVVSRNRTVQERDPSQISHIVSENQQRQPLLNSVNQRTLQENSKSNPRYEEQINRKSVIVPQTEILASLSQPDVLDKPESLQTESPLSRQQLQAINKYKIQQLMQYLSEYKTLTPSSESSNLESPLNPKMVEELKRRLNAAARDQNFCKFLQSSNAPCKDIACQQKRELSIYVKSLLCS